MSYTHLKLNLLTRWCQYEALGGGAGRAGGQLAGGWCGEYLGHMCIKDWSTGWCPHTCKGLKWCTGGMGGKPMVGATQWFTISLFPPTPLFVPNNCLLWLQLAASASRANKCFLCDLYFYIYVFKIQYSILEINLP